mmetsp:Transcript_25000/g.57595  ORF Transcript_25000/g.57595 Transcript_25000/m.57595 type:complete len:93 (+) Transcript_25000:395-673(+)
MIFAVLTLDALIVSVLRCSSVTCHCPKRVLKCLVIGFALSARTIAFATHTMLSRPPIPSRPCFCASAVHCLDAVAKAKTTRPALGIECITML